MNEKNDSELRSSDHDNGLQAVGETGPDGSDKTRGSQHVGGSVDDSGGSADGMHGADGVSASDGVNPAYCVDSREIAHSGHIIADGQSERNEGAMKSSSFFGNLSSKIGNFNSASCEEGNTDGNANGSAHGSANGTANGSAHSVSELGLLSKGASSEFQAEAMDTVPQSGELELALTAIAAFNERKSELKVSRGEIYLSEKEFGIISYLLSGSGFRFCLMDDPKKKKKRELLRLDELLLEAKRWKGDGLSSSVKREGSHERKLGGHLTYVDNSEDPNGAYPYDAEDGSEEEGKLSTRVGELGIHWDRSEVIKGDESPTERETQRRPKGEGYTHLDSASERGNKTNNDISNEMRSGADYKERLQLCEEVLTQLRNSFYDKILNIENNFKNISNKIEESNCFYFQCIMDKLKNGGYENVFLIYNDIYLYVNNLLFLSKPSSFIWMKVHELSTQINACISEVQLRMEKKKSSSSQGAQPALQEQADKDEVDKEKALLHPPGDTLEQSINEEEKLAFQLLLGKLHQDIHFELFRKFKSKAVWKTLEGGEIELDDKLTKADVFREMYNWCKVQLELKSKRSYVSESESDSSKDSY
ncbi:hypothetical protein C922_04140 [Plasmodium inui San Antonio 1]|uniref:Uncharacterized protein n=1 Tax=Plasmodium inui San Antonio 1 TaxID=1237626 RepID=W7A154_9APIC|nr:hypothetical protein C922_04140 [Plasmodium inui San Antonio 1]EUD65400.1 hypothetical protein C922_04140 [Plasmodium inui San Antonio 1]